MELKACAALLLIGCVCQQRAGCSLPDYTPTSPRLQVEIPESNVVTSLKKKNGISRLPGLCQRLKRRRVTVLCNREKFCWRGRSQKTWSVQVRPYIPPPLHYYKCQRSGHTAVCRGDRGLDIQQSVEETEVWTYSSL